MRHAKAAKRRIEQDQEFARKQITEWPTAQRAVDKGRDDLAREALVEKRQVEHVEALDRELAQCGGVIDQYQTTKLLEES